MKLFAFRPKGHGEDSFFVMAESEEEAKKNVDDIITNGKSKEGHPICSHGWNTDYYEMTTYEIGEVAINSN